MQSNFKKYCQMKWSLSYWVPIFRRPPFCIVLSKLNPLKWTSTSSGVSTVFLVEFLCPQEANKQNAALTTRSLRLHLAWCSATAPWWSGLGRPGCVRGADPERGWSHGTGSPRCTTWRRRPSALLPDSPRGRRSWGDKPTGINTHPGWSLLDSISTKC